MSMFIISRIDILQEYMIRVSENLQRQSGMLQIEKAAIHSFYNPSQYSW